MVEAEHERNKLIIEMLQRLSKSETKLEDVKEDLANFIISNDEFKCRYYNFEKEVMRKLDKIEDKLVDGSCTTTEPSKKYKYTLYGTVITSISLVIIEVLKAIISAVA